MNTRSTSSTTTTTSPLDTSFLVSPTTSDNAILIVDASYSTVFEYAGSEGRGTIFDKFLEVAQGLNHARFHVIFWNSVNENNEAFPEGFFKIPFVVEKEGLSLAFRMVPTIESARVTMPHLGFDNVSVWLDDKFSSVVYFLTDGEIGYYNAPHYVLQDLKDKVAESIRNLTRQYPGVQVNLITVENVNRDFGRIESLTGAAGCDLYKVITDNNLTQQIAKFVSFTPNNDQGYVHINKMRAPPGHIPYGEAYFSELHAGKFVKYIAQVVKEAHSDETLLLKITQDLSVSLAAMVRGKPKNVKDKIVAEFVAMFQGSVIDPIFISFILQTQIKNECAGSASLFASYRAQLKDLYKNADEMLVRDAKSAIGLRNRFISVPVNNKLVTGEADLCTLPVIIGSKAYQCGGCLVDGQTVPALPLDFQLAEGIAEQCMRQWVRGLVSQAHHRVYFMSDAVIYHTLKIVLRVVLSEVSDEIKDCYRRIGHLMLRKKCANSESTELKRLSEGQLFTDNGAIKPFLGGMTAVAQELNLNVKPLTMWYLLCLALGNDEVLDRQLPHCESDLNIDFPDVPRSQLKTLLLHPSVVSVVPKYEHYDMPVEESLDYTCLITLDDTSSTGGYTFTPHTSLRGGLCCPRQVLTEGGYLRLIHSGNASMCPVCYVPLTEDNFRSVPAKRASALEEGSVFAKGSPRMYLSEPVSHSITTTPLPTITSAANTNATGRGKRILVAMCGTVGCGKTTYSEKLKAYVESKGGHCSIEGVDKYCKDGDSFATAAAKIKANILALDAITDRDVILVIDSCGERTNPKDIFGVNLSSWTLKKVFPNLERSNLEGYMAWSLRNVLSRPACTDDCNYWLNPQQAGLATCIQVHQRKATSHFGKRVPAPLGQSYQASTVGHAIDALSASAEAYEKTLKENPDFCKIY